MSRGLISVGSAARQSDAPAAAALEKMADPSINATSGADPGCRLEPGYVVGLSLINVFTFVIGQPINSKLLWLTFSSRRSGDILNWNLALFHSFLYLVSVLHLVFLFALQHHQQQLLQVLLVYAQTGGPMSLAFICVERYVAVLHPTAYPLLKKYRCREAGAAAVWLSSLSIAMMTIFCNETVVKFVPFIVMLLVTKVMVWCSVRIARALRTAGPGRDQLHPAKKKAFRTVCATTAINLLGYIPVALMHKVKFLDERTFQCTLTPVCILVLAAASVVHPLFYLSTQGTLSTCFKGHKKPT